MPMHLQVKLLRFLENGEMLRVGGLKSMKVNTRVITATNRNLEEMVANGTFRSDLYYRLNVVPIRIPFLAKRRAEVAYSFPGNIRELENMTKRLVTMVEDEGVTVRHLSGHL